MRVGIRLIDVSKYPDDTEVGGVRQVRGAWPPYRRASELERTTQGRPSLTGKEWR